MPIIYTGGFAQGAGAAMQQFAPVNKSVRDTMLKLEDMRMREELMQQNQALAYARLQQQEDQFQQSQALRVDLQDRADALARERMAQAESQFGERMAQSEFQFGESQALREREQDLRERQQEERERLAELQTQRQEELDAYKKEQDKIRNEFTDEELEQRQQQLDEAHEARMRELDLKEKQLEATTGVNLDKAKQQELEFYYDSIPEDARTSPTAAGLQQSIAALQGLVANYEEQGFSPLTVEEAEGLENALNQYFGVDIMAQGLPSAAEVEANPNFGRALALMGGALSTAQSRVLRHAVNKGYDDFLETAEKQYGDFAGSGLGSELLQNVTSLYNTALRTQGEERLEAIDQLNESIAAFKLAGDLQESKANVTHLVRKELAEKADELDDDVISEVNKLLNRLNTKSFDGDPKDILMEARIMYDKKYRDAAAIGRRQAEEASADSVEAAYNLGARDAQERAAATPPAATPPAATPPAATPEGAGAGSAPSETGGVIVELDSAYLPVQQAYAKFMRNNNLTPSDETMRKFAQSPEGAEALRQYREERKKKEQEEAELVSRLPGRGVGGGRKM